MWRSRQAISLLLLVTVTLGACNSEIPKPSYTRTVLKVSRSLPGETEELKVRTSEGNLATLIVKRRDKSSFALDDSKLAPKLSRENSNVTLQNKSDSLSSETNEARKDDVRKLEAAQIDRIRARFSKSPGPQDQEARVNHTNEESMPERKQSTTDSVIDYGNWTPLDADGRTLRRKNGRGGMEEKEEKEEEEYRNWKPLQTNLDAEDRSNYVKLGEAASDSNGTPLARSFQDWAQRNLEFEDRSVGKNERALYYAYVARQPHPSTRTNLGVNSSKNRDGKDHAVPPEVTVRSEINVKAVPKRKAMSLDNDGTPVIHGSRVPDEPIDKVQTWRNARVINNKLITEGSSTVTVEPFFASYSADSVEKRQKFDKFFKDINRRYGRNYDEEGRNVYFEWDPRNYEALKAEVYEPRNDQYRANIHKRMLHPDGVASYPISQRYTPSSQTIAPVALKPGARAPVLQYAHPELGVQPAKILKNEKRRPDNFPESQHSFTEQRHKKKYVLNDKNIVDSYTTKNYYPNQHFYGLKRPIEPPFWVKISENLKNQFSNGVERVSEFTRPVIDPLVEATHKISQNLGLSKGKEAQDKIGTVTSGTSILIPALGLVASGAALGIGAVAVGRYLDVDVLKRSSGYDVDLEHKRALQADARLTTIEDTSARSNQAMPMPMPMPTPTPTMYVVRNVSPRDNRAEDESASDGIFFVLEDDRNAERIENRESRHMVDERHYVETGGRRRRSLDYLDIFKTETDMRNLVRSKRFQRKGADSISEIVEIDIPTQGRIDLTDFLVSKKNKKHDSSENTILVVEDGSISPDHFGTDTFGQTALENSATIIQDIIDRDTASMVSSKENSGQRRRGQKFDDAHLVLENASRALADNSDDETIERIRKDVRESDLLRKSSGRRERSVESDQELEDALQNLESAEVAQVAHVQGDWTNTPCAKRIFCDAMLERGSDAAILMEKKMTALLRLIQPEAAVQVSSHFEDVMSAVRKHDCSSFSCSQARPGNIFL